MKLNTTYLKALAASIFHHYRSLDNPPANEMKIPISQIRKDRDMQNAYTALITYIVEYCGEKEHTVRVKFKVDDVGRFLSNSCAYA